MPSSRLLKRKAAEEAQQSIKKARQDASAEGYEPEEESDDDDIFEPPVEGEEESDNDAFEPPVEPNSSPARPKRKGANLLPPTRADVAEVTAAGTARAESEAKRLWNLACPFEGCGKLFNRPCRLQSHIRSHNNDRPFVCDKPDCGKSFTRKEHLTRHIALTHSDEVVAKCEWHGCGREFKTNSRLRRHMEVHEGTEVLRCKDYPPCSKKFRKPGGLEAHIRRDHLNLKPWPCTRTDPNNDEPCTRAYDTEAALRKHEREYHHGNPNRQKFICLMCTEGQKNDGDAGLLSPPQDLVAFATARELSNHMTVAHPPVCPHCGLKCATRATLKSHVEIVHEPPPGGNPIFPCTEPGCDRVFTRRGNLSVHVRTVHLNIKKFVCGEYDVAKLNKEDAKAWNGQGACGQAFGCKNTLEQHIQTKHLHSLNRKEKRKQRKQNGPKKEKASMLSQLTGVGYEERRPIACLVPDCEHRFFRDYDLSVHLKAKHSFSDEQVSERILERDALQGGQFWIGGLDAGEEPYWTPPDGNFEIYRLPLEGEMAIDPALTPYDSPHVYAGEGTMEGDAEMQAMDCELGLTGMPAINVRDGAMMWE